LIYRNRLLNQPKEVHMSHKFKLTILLFITISANTYSAISPICVFGEFFEKITKKEKSDAEKKKEKEKLAEQKQLQKAKNLKVELEKLLIDEKLTEATKIINNGIAGMGLLLRLDTRIYESSCNLFKQYKLLEKIHDQYLKSQSSTLEKKFRDQYTLIILSRSNLNKVSDSDKQKVSAKLNKKVEETIIKSDKLNKSLLTFKNNKEKEKQAFVTEVEKLIIQGKFKIAREKISSIKLNEKVNLDLDAWSKKQKLEKLLLICERIKSIEQNIQTYLKSPTKPEEEKIRDEITLLNNSTSSLIRIYSEEQRILFQEKIQKCNKLQRKFYALAREKQKEQHLKEEVLQKKEREKKRLAEEKLNEERKEAEAERAQIRKERKEQKKRLSNSIIKWAQKMGYQTDSKDVFGFVSGLKSGHVNAGDLIDTVLTNVLSIRDSWFKAISSNNKVTIYNLNVPFEARYTHPASANATGTIMIINSELTMDDTSLRLDKVYVFKGLKSYTTVLGANKVIPSFIAVDLPKID